MPPSVQPCALQPCKQLSSLQLGSVGNYRSCQFGQMRQFRTRRLSHQTRAAGDRPWDFGRFVRTISYFNEAPNPGELLKSIIEDPLKAISAFTGNSSVEEVKSVIQPLFGSTSAASGTGEGSVKGPRPPVILVAGASGGVGKRVVEALLRRGKHVRALVRDADKGAQLLGGLTGPAGSSLELVAADITQASTLVPEMFNDVRGMVIATAVKVAPKEGDTVDRAKYMQGIQFFDPEIVGDTPETVELVGVSNLVKAAQEHLGYTQGKIIFSPTGEGISQAWGALDDVVMGGRSESGFEIRSGAGEDGGLGGMFSGLISVGGGGGFASVRTKNYEPKLDLGAYEGMQLRLKGDGLRYKCIIRTDSNWDGIGYCKSFNTVAGEWQTIKLPFSEFMPVFRAKTVRDGTRLNPSEVSSVQLMLSKFEYDGELNPAFKDGPFSLPVGSIKAVLKEPAAPRIVHVSSAGVTRPNRPGIDVNVEPPAVRMNDELGGILTFKLKGEDFVRTSGVPFAVVRPVALTEEPAGAELLLDQGDTIKGKISREEIADLCAALLETPSAADTTFEIKSTVPFSQPFVVDPAQPPPPRNWQELLGSSELLKGVTGKTIDGKYTGKEQEPGFK